MVYDAELSRLRPAPPRAASRRCLDVDRKPVSIAYHSAMIRKSHFDPLRVREEIAIAAARLIAEDGLDYSTAKRKAARQVVGETRIGGEWLPDNDQIEDEIREYQALFQSDSQPAVLRACAKSRSNGWNGCSLQPLSDRRRAQWHSRRALGHPSAVLLR